MPLLKPIVAEPGDMVVAATSGSSGAGRAPKPQLLASEVMGSVGAYQAGGAHRHTPEIEQALSEVAGTPATVSFTPAIAPMPRGILAVCTARLTPRVPQSGGEAADAATAGSNAVHLQVAADLHAGRAVAVAAIDNLGKGAAGQAVQVANLMLCLPETAGLSANGVAP